MTEDKVLPKDTDSDYSLPGRIEESNAEYFEIDNIPPKPQNKIIIIVAISFLLISAGAFTFYFINQPEIDSQLIDNTLNFDPEKHEALSLIEDESKDENTIIEVIQRGFMILDRVLRPAKVIVSKKSQKN